MLAVSSKLNKGKFMQKLKKIIEKSWENRDQINTKTKGEVRKAVDEVLNLLDSGKLRVAEKVKNKWVINDWAKKAILLSFRLNDNVLMDSGLEIGKSEATWYDKVPSKFMGWKEKNFKDAGFRAVPGAIVRKSAFIGKGVVLLPSFVNLGAYVDEGTMVDTWATVGSCAQIGKNCHISGGAGIGGVLEPLQANPVIIEDNCFIGARAEIAEGVIVGTGSVISMGVYIGASTRIVDRETGEVFYGKVPPYSVVVAGSMPGKTKGKKGAPVPNLYCVVIVKKVDEKTRSKTSINELLRD
jgi:2,3,4,5-tetrahydropyridine-2-carboxylate N-succinyltransferase